MKDLRFNIYGTDKTSAAFQKINRNADNMSRRLSKIKGKFGALKAAATAALGAIIAKLVESTSKIVDFSQRLGMSAADLSELAYAAEQNGVAFNQVSVGLQRMTRRIAEVATLGKGTALEALDSLGLSAQQLINLPVDQQFEAIAQKLSEVENQSEKVRLAFKLFDSEGVGLIQMMDDGAAGIQKFRSELIDLGGVVDQQQAETIPALGDAWDRAVTAVTGFGRTILSVVAPVLEALINLFTGLISRITKVVKTVMLLDDVFASAMASVGSFFGLLEDDVAVRVSDKLGDKWEKIWGATEKATDAQKKYNAEVKKIQPQITQQTNEPKLKRETIAPRDELRKVRDDFGETTDDITDDMKDAFRDVFRNVGDGFDGLAAGIQSTFDRMQQRILNQAIDAFLDVQFPSSTGGGGSGGLLDGVFGGIGDFVGSLFGGGRAAGGPTSSGKIYRVNENQPEFFKSNQGGRVIPLSKMGALQQGIASSSITVNVHNNAGAEVSVSSRQTEQGEQLDIIVDRMVAEKINTPGAKTNRALRDYSNQGLIAR